MAPITTGVDIDYSIAYATYSAFAVNGSGDSVSVTFHVAFGSGTTDATVLDSAVTDALTALADAGLTVSQVSKIYEGGSDNTFTDADYTYP